MRHFRAKSQHLDTLLPEHTRIFFSFDFGVLKGPVSSSNKNVLYVVENFPSVAPIDKSTYGKPPICFPKSPFPQPSPFLPGDRSRGQCLNAPPQQFANAPLSFGPHEYVRCHPFGGKERGCLRARMKGRETRLPPPPLPPQKSFWRFPSFFARGWRKGGSF